MAWTQLHQTLRNHPKTAELAEYMGWTDPKNPYSEIAIHATVGALVFFWHWCLDYAPIGDLRKISMLRLASATELPPACAMRFVEGMIIVGFIDKADNMLRIHDWPDYAGRYLVESKFKRTHDKILEMRFLYKNVDNVHGQTLDMSTDSPRTSCGHVHGQVADMSTNLSGDSADMSKVDRGEEKREDNKRKKTEASVSQLTDVVPEKLRTTKFLKVWEDFCIHRQGMDKSKRLTVKASEIYMDRFLQWGEQAAIDSMLDTIANGWQGLFAPGKSPSKQNGSSHKAPLDPVTRTTIYG